MPDIAVTIPIVKRAVDRLLRYLNQTVVDFPVIDADERWSYARLIAITLDVGKCQCKLDAQSGTRRLCGKPAHDLSAWTADGDISPELSIFQAVCGQNQLRPVAVSQGMLFPFLQDDWGLKLVKVGFKRCSQNHLYEGSTCPYEHREVFNPIQHEIRAKDWLVIVGTYKANVPYWACGNGRHAHYYSQQYCRQMTPDIPMSHHLTTHDCCPLEQCERFGQRHGQNGTLLWCRTSFI